MLGKTSELIGGFVGYVVLALGLAFGSAALAGTPPTLIAQPGVTAPASIAELARALKYDAITIYEYVYTNIEYSPTDGVKKGALGTLLDGTGNDLDQATLMAALLRQSGYTVSYKYGYVQLTPAQAAAWLGTDPASWCNAATLLAQGGIPWSTSSTPQPPCNTPPTYLYIAHAWLSVTGGSFGTNTYSFDPSYKVYTTPASGIGLASAMGYSQSSFMTAAKAGSTSGTNSIKNLNSANITNSLLAYTNSLVSYIKANVPTAKPNDVLGGRYIQPITQPYTPQTTLPYEIPGYTPFVWTGDVPSPYHTTLRLQIGGIDQTFYSDEIYGHRLTIVYDASNEPQLYVDGVLNSTGTANANTISYTVTFPFCYATSAPGATCASVSGYTNQFAFQSVILPGNGYTYAIVNGWDYTGRGIVEFHRKQLQANKAAGASASSESVLGEALNMVGYSWLAQISATGKVNDRLIGAKFVVQCAVGVVGQAAGPYIDIPGLFVGSTPLDGTPNKQVTTLFANFSAGSALEWGTLDQNFLNSGVGAVSTVKLFDIANSVGNVFYQATNANWTSVQANLSNYTPSDLATIYTNYIAPGWTVVLPQDGNLTQGGWSGAGYIATNFTGSLAGIGYLISHNFKGGFPDAPLLPQFVSPPVAETGVPIMPPAFWFSSEPIDLSSGAYIYDHDDLTMGSGSYPFNMAFRRSYNSNSSQTPGPLGPGWTHNFSITAVINSDGLKGLGQDSPIDASAAIAASYVIQDLLSDASKPVDKIVVATLVQKWLMDRLINNTVNVTTGAQSEPFVLMADGSYNPRLGSSSRLSLSGGAYTLQNKDGTTYSFNSAGNISTWQSPSSASVSFTYDTSTPPLLTSVSNSVGRSFALTYNGSQQLVSVSDSSSPARSVSYAYDTPGNLASFTDPLGNATTYAYVPGASLSASGLLTQIFYPANPGVAAVTNTYDTLNRVQTQANALGVTWNYFFAGYRSEEDDAYNTQHVLYYNPRGLGLFDVQDLTGLNIQTATLFDGLDRLSLVTQPEGGTTTYTYATANAWANNVASVVRGPKPGSPLSPLTTTYAYDPTFNKPISVTDPLGLVTAMTYDSSTGNLLKVTTDVGGGAHFNANTSFVYNALGLIASKTDPAGMVAQLAYDGVGNLISTVRDPGTGGHINETTTYGYDSVGNVTSGTDPNGRTTTNTYDAARRLLTSTQPAAMSGTSGVVTSLTYDSNSRLLQTQQSLAGAVLRTTSATYTPTGKQATETDANGNLTRYAYDLLDRRSSVTDAMNRVTQFTYDVLSRPYQVFNPAVTGLITGGALTQQTYSADGLRASLTDANNNTTAFAYDGFNRLATTTYPPDSGSIQRTETYTYDADSNVATRTTRASQMIAYAYDTLNRLITKTPPSSPVVSYSYDVAGRLTAVSDNSAAIQPVATPGSSIQYATNYSYDVLNRPTNVSWSPAPTATAPAAASPVVFTHTYNAVNQRTSQTVDSAWIDYPAATASTTSYTSNMLNQYAAIGSASPTYDTNANLTSDGIYTFGYDVENRLVSSSGGGNTASYAFDGRGRRKLKTVNGTTTISITDADNREVLEYDGSSGTILRWYAYGLGPNELLNQMDIGGGTRTLLIPDTLGSIIGSMLSTATAISSFSYQAYGSSASAPAQFGYTGQRVDTVSGTYYYRARQYSPMLGRFHQTDPVSYNGGILLYAYAVNDPLNFIDPHGLDPAPVHPAEQTGAPTSSFDQGPHNYDFMFPLCSDCTKLDAFDAMRTFSAPEAPYAEQGTKRVVLAGNNPIMQTVDVPTLTITNVTEPGHAFYPGTVQLSIVQNSIGVVSVRIVGTGTGGYSTLNQIGGPVLFGVLSTLAYGQLNPTKLNLP